MAETEPVTTDAAAEAPATPPPALHPHPAAAGDAAYEARFYVDEEAEKKRKEAREKAKAKAAADPNAEPEPVEMIEIKDRASGAVIFAGPANAEWKKDDQGQVITYAERFGHKKEGAEAATAEPADGEPVDLNTKTMAELKAALDAAGVSYPSNASKATLIQLVEDNDVTVE